MMSKKDEKIKIMLITEDAAFLSRVERLLCRDFELTSDTFSDQDSFRTRLLSEQPCVVLVDGAMEDSCLQTLIQTVEKQLYVSDSRPAALIVGGGDLLGASLPDDGHFQWVSEEENQDSVLLRRLETLVAVQRIRYGSLEPDGSRELLRTVQKVKSLRLSFWGGKNS
ncbi:MAG: hypothetical protein ACI3YK_04690 [Eubacteriales bacterium]